MTKIGADAGGDPTRDVIDAVVARLPRRARQGVDWALSRWPGRVMTRTASGFIRIELFDRSMAIAAQFFTSVFPILIMAATWFGPDSGDLGNAVGLPEQTQSVLDEALQDSGSASFGVAGALIVLASATSLSRALTRAFATIWLLPRPRFRLSSLWRWVTALLALAMAVVLTLTAVRQAQGVPPRGLWSLTLGAGLDTLVAVFVPWLLLSGRVRPLLLLPGALILATTLTFVRPATAVWLPRALDVSANRYGALGVAFTYLAVLYVLAFCWLVAALVGQVVATDEGALGRWIQKRSGGAPPRREPDTA